MDSHTSTQDFKPNIIHQASVRLSFECFVCRISDGHRLQGLCFSWFILCLCANTVAKLFGSTCRSQPLHIRSIPLRYSAIIHPTVRTPLAEMPKPSKVNNREIKVAH